MDPDHYQQQLAPLLDAMSPAARFMVKAMLDEESGYSINPDPDDYRQAMTFFRSALGLALEHDHDELAARVRRCREQHDSRSKDAPSRSAKLAWVPL